MYRPIALVVLLLLLSSNLFAQHTYTFSFEEVFPIVGRSNYGSLRVIDMRSDKQSMGYAKTGAFDRKAKIVTPKPLDTLFSEQFTKMLKEARGLDSSEELLFVLYDIIIEDVSSGEPVGTFFIDGDFYGGTRDNYKYLGTMDTLNETSGGFNITERLIKGAQANLSYIFSQYALKKASAKSTVYNEAQLLNRRVEENNKYRIYQDAPGFRKGVYYTLDQFLNNQPVDTPVVVKEFKTNNGRPNIVVFYPKAKGRKATPLKSNRFFTAYDGESWACGVDQNTYAKMEYKDGNFYTVRSLPGARRSNNGAAVSGAMFGVAGFLVATAVQNGNNPGTEPTRYYCRFDPATRKYIPIRRAR